MKQPNSRKTRENTAFLYSRLSRDDNTDGDSYSIQNQKKLLAKVAKEKGYTNLVHYYDDGKTGVTMDRPGFNDMMDDLEKGKAAAVFFKDMSRLGRNYIEVGRLCEEFFPENDIRYVAVSDNIDSDLGEDELTPIRNMFNEWYSRDISKKKRISNNIKGNSGQPLGLPPYGYIKDPNDINRWLVEPEAAAIVRKIFDLNIEGYGSDQIATKLSESRILVPAAYWKKRGINRPSKANKDDPYNWRAATIYYILRKQEYCGDIINFKTFSKSYKNKKRHRSEKEDWVIFKDVNEPIIDRKTFEQVQSKHKKSRKRTNHSGERNMFSGIVRCADCGAVMSYHFNQANRSIEYFNCYNNNKARKTCDKTHYVRVDFLEQVVLAEIRRYARFVRDNEEKFISIVNENMDADGLEKNQFKEKELAVLVARDKELDILFEQIYEDNVSGKLSDSRFGKLSVSYEKEQKSVGKRIKEIEEELEHESNVTGSLDRFIDSIKKYVRIRKLTSHILDEVIDSIDVHHAEKKDGATYQQIDIYYNFVGAVNIPDVESSSEPVVTMKTRRGVEVNYAFA